MDKKTGILLFLFKTIAVVLILSCFNYLIIPLAIQHDYIIAQNYDIVYEYKNDVLLNDSFYKLTDILSYKNSNGLKSEILMQKPVKYSDCTPFKYTDYLEKNEIVITRNIADVLDLHTGDEFEFYNPIFSCYYDCVIKDILPVAYGFYENAVDRHMGVIIVGYNKEIASLVQMSSVLMAKYSYATSNAGIVLKKSHDNKTILSNTVKDIISYFISGTFIILIIGYVFWRLYSHYGLEIVKRMYIMGSQKKNMIKEIQYAYMVPFVISDVLGSLIVCSISILLFRFVPLWVSIPMIIDVIMICLYTYRSIVNVRKEN